MKKFLQTTLTVLLLSAVVFAQKGTPPGTHAAPSQTKVIVMGAYSNSIVLLSPAEGKLIATEDAFKPVIFRWTAVSPKPKETVTYRLRVWQLMKGQNATEAMRVNQPVVTKEVENSTQAAITNIYTGPCKPPYMCNFVWAVEAFTGDNIAAGKPYGASENNSFKFNVDGQNNIDQESDNSQSTKAGDKRIDKSWPTVKNLDANGDPVHGVDIKPGIKSTGKVEKELDKSQPQKNLDANGNPIRPLDVKPQIYSNKRRPSGNASWELYKVKFPCNCFWCGLKS